MSIKTLMITYGAQLKALSPKYDVVYALSEKTPVEFERPEEVKLSFACIADTHLIKKNEAVVNLENAFKDVKNAKKKFDALLVAGDITEYGTRGEYNGFFGVSDKYSDYYKIFLTVGNHDVRFTYRKNQKIIMRKVNEYLNINTQKKTFYSYDINGYTFIVLGTEKRVLEKAHITEEQMEFLDKELSRAEQNGKPAFVMCHQAFAFTHGLPEVWKTGDMGEQSDRVRAVMEKHKNVFFITGHLHGGIYENTFEVLNKENNVVSVSIPGYRKENNFGNTDCGNGYYCQVYEDKVVFKARNFLRGENTEGEFTRFEIPLNS